MDLLLNDNIVCSSGDSYPYKSYITTLLSYSDASKDTFLKDLEGFGKDTPYLFDDAENERAVDSAKYVVRNGQAFELFGRLHLDLVFQPRLIPNLTDIKINMNRTRDEFCLMSHVSGSEYKLVLMDATLSCRRVKLEPAHQLSIEKSIGSLGCKYPVQQIVVKPFNVASGTSSQILDSVFSNGELPSRLLVGMTLNSAYYGNYTKNPFHMQHFGLSHASLSFGGKTFPPNGYSLNLKENNFIECFHKLYEVFGRYPEDFSFGLDSEAWLNGNFLLPFDLSIDECYKSSFTSPKKYGSLKLSLKWDKPLDSIITILVFGFFDNTIYMDVNRTYSVGAVH